MKKQTYCIAGVLIAVFGFAQLCLAAGPAATITQAGGYTLRLSLTSSVPINAYNFEFTYPQDIVAITGLDTSRSIITVLPHPIEAAGGKLIIRGGSNQSFSGSDGEVVTLYVKPLKTGVLRFTPVRMRVFSADGKGTPENVTFAMKAISVTDASLARYEQSSLAALPPDTLPPQIQPLKVVDNPIDPQTKLLVIVASDTQSGVGSLLVRTKAWVFWSPWRKAVNPYPLAGNEWAIEVAAFDNAGNRISQIYYRPQLLWPKAVGVSLVVIALVVSSWRMHRRRRHRM